MGTPVFQNFDKDLQRELPLRHKQLHTHVPLVLNFIFSIKKKIFRKIIAMWMQGLHSYQMPTVLGSRAHSLALISFYFIIT